jgi:hypothetical protein
MTHLLEFKSALRSKNSRTCNADLIANLDMNIKTNAGDYGVI